MRRYVLIFILGLLFSCKKEKADPEIPVGALYKITAQEKLQNSLEYNNGRVSRVLAFNSCETPYSIVEYGYSGDQITFVRSGMRGAMFSSSGALCDPDGRFDYHDYTIQFDAQDRHSKVTSGNLQVDYEYNGQEATVRMSDKAGNLSRVYYLKFDNNGNIVEQRNADSGTAGITRYEYDNNPNPMQGLSSYSWTDPFTCANNVVRAVDGSGQVQWERKFTYDAAGRPLTCDEDNGLTYQYHYR